MLLHYSDTGHGQPIVLLHGMAGSTNYWNNITPALSVNNRVIALDLLGFGRSPKPKNVTYDIKTHMECILETLDQLQVDYPVTLVGHSMGALLALKLAAVHPDKVSKLVLLSLPFYNSPVEAKQSITKNTRIRQLAYYGPTSHALCTTWCRFLRPLSKHIAPLYLKSLPKEVAEDSVLHTWQSYSQTLENVITHQDVPRDLNGLHMPIRIVYGTQEDQTIQQNLQSLEGLRANLQFKVVTDGHNIGVHDSPDITQAILN